MNHKLNHSNHSCKGISSHHSFCPQELPASTPESNFCIPKDCPEKIPTKRFASPNSPLSPEELKQLKECIEGINDLLRAFGNPRDLENLSGLRAHFRKLRGILLRIKVGCENNREMVIGILEQAGRDFLMLRNIENMFFIPYNRICFIHSSPMDHTSREHEPELLNIDPCLRTEIVLNFGRVVSSDPNLVNIFFGVPLYLQLVTFFGCSVMVAVEGESEIVEGVIIESTEKAIHLQIDNQIRQINIDEICSIKI